VASKSLSVWGVTLLESVGDELADRPDNLLVVVDSKAVAVRWGLRRLRRPPYSQ
jgi:hypothetical protein